MISTCWNQRPTVLVSSASRDGGKQGEQEQAPGATEAPTVVLRSVCSVLVWCPGAVLSVVLRYGMGTPRRKKLPIERMMLGSLFELMKGTGMS